jgi:hypothetical protein
MSLSRRQSAGQNRDVKTTERSFENVAQLKNFGTTATNQNLIPEEIKRLNSSNVHYHSVHNIPYSSLPSKNIKIRLDYNFVCGYVCVSNFVSHRLRVFQKRVLRYLDRRGMK